MQKIRIESPSLPQDYDGPFLALGTRLWLNDYEVTEMTDINVRYPVNGAVTVTLDLLANESLNLEHNGVDVHINVICSEGFRVVANPSVDGKYVYTCERVEAI